MKKLFSILTITVLVSGILSPIALGAEPEGDAALADLLAELSGSNAVENPTPAADTPEPTPTPTPEVEDVQQPAEKTAGQEEHQAAEDILDDIEGDKWSYASSEKIQIVDISANSVTISTTEALYDGAAVSNYKVFYSESTLSNTQDYGTIQSKDLPVVRSQNNMVELVLDGLENEKTYFILVTPIHPTDPTADPLTMTSSEVKFTTKAAAPQVGPTTKLFSDVSHTQSANTLTLTWTPTDLVQKGQISIRHNDEVSYTTLGTVPMTSGKYTFTVNKSGNFFLKAHGVDEGGKVLGQEQVINVKVEAFELPEAPVENAPQVGPTMDLIMALMIFAVMVYFVYRFRRAER